MIINNPTTRKNLNEFLSLAMSKGKKQGLNKGQLDSLYNNAISVFFFNDLEKLAKVGMAPSLESHKHSTLARSDSPSPAFRRLLR